ncbi:Protein FAR-RED ELONGATED HYPOCOTYL 1 [Linum perenne]
MMMMMMVVEDNGNPPEFNRKRKLAGDQLGLPVAKHECWDHHKFLTEPSPTPERSEEVDDRITRAIDENAQGKSTDNNRMISDHESGNGSNSFLGDSDRTMSLLSESKFGSEVSKTCPSSTSSFNWLSESSKDPQCSSDNATSSARDYDKFQAYDEEDDQMLEYEKRFGYEYTEYNDSGIPLGDEELDGDLCTSSVNPRVHLLSSGRWTVKQESQSGARKPTIDQEFEQYFSGLMLQ